MQQKGELISFRPDIKVVDCTIRDGGLVNNFYFDDEFVKDLYKTNAAAGVDYMEFGYKASKDLFDVNEFGKWKFCDEQDIRDIVGDNDTDMKISVMADVGRTDYKKDIIPIAKRFEAQGYRIFATRGTASILTENGIKVTRTNKLEQPSPNLMDLILGHKIDVVIDTPPQGVEHQKDGFVIRRNAIETGVNVLTSLDTAEALVTSLENTDLNHLTLVDIATIDNR